MTVMCYSEMESPSLALSSPHTSVHSFNMFLFYIPLNRVYNTVIIELLLHLQLFCAFISKEM